MGFLHDLYAAQGRNLPERTTPFVFMDKAAYVSPLDRTVVDGRSAHHEHMKRHGVLEAGDMKLGEMARSAEPVGIREDITRAVQEVSSR